MCHVQQTKEYDSNDSHTEQMSALNSAKSQSVCAVCLKTIVEIMSKISDDLWTLKHILNEERMELFNARYLTMMPNTQFGR